MKLKRKSLVFLTCFLVTIAAILGIAKQMQPIEDAASLRSLAAQRGISIGAAMVLTPLRENPIYGEVLAREFNMVTPEDAMKFGPLTRDGRDRYDFSKTDAIVEFAREHQMQIRGHTLVWHNRQPEWLREGEFSRDELIEILRSHIQTVVGRYKGQIAVWDVVNEAIADDGSFRDTIWWRGIGPEYIEMAFRWAHEADPDALLFYNDYGGEGMNQKSDVIFNLVQDLQQQGVPIHGVGLQMHIWNVDKYPKPQQVSQNMKRIGELGLQVQITEMDVGLQKGTGTEEARLAAQANLYGDMLRVCLNADNCTAFVLWGFTDAYSWTRQIEEEPNLPLIFDESFQPKPAYFKLREVLRQGN